MPWRKKDVQVIERCSGVAGEIQLQKRGDEYEIIYNGLFLMATYNGTSEKEAVARAIEVVRLKSDEPIRVLMGGLGVGFSLRKALDYQVVCEVVISELEPVIIKWNQNYFGEINGCALGDQRVTVVNKDFRDVLKEEAKKVEYKRKQGFHVIMVDTDNGSSWLSLPANSFFYEPEGLELIKRTLNPAGAAGFWCASREKAFEDCLKKMFSEVSFHTVVEKTGQEGCYYIAVN